MNKKTKLMVVLSMLAVMLVVGSMYEGRLGEDDFDYDERVECNDRGSDYVWNWDINTCMTQAEYDEYIHRTTLPYTTPVFTTTQPMTTIPRINEMEICNSMVGKIWDHVDGVCVDADVVEFQFSILLLPILLGVSIVAVVIKIKNRKKVI